MPKVIGIIPAHLESTRLPRKLLLDETGKPLIVHTIEQAKKAKMLDDLIVATDSEEIEAACKEHCPVVLTGWCANGTERWAKAGGLWIENGCDFVVNIQGDEPEINPTLIDDVAIQAIMSGADVATPVAYDQNCSDNTEVVKAIVNLRGDAVHFTRLTNPAFRGVSLRHIGVYAYRADALLKYNTMMESPHGVAERLEQLRFTWNGYRISTIKANHAYPGINTRADYDAFKARYLSKNPLSASVVPSTIATL